MSERRKAAIDALRAETYGAEWVPDVVDIVLRAADRAETEGQP